jgi:hypothetical protein
LYNKTARILSFFLLAALLFLYGCDNSVQENPKENNQNMESKYYAGSTTNAEAKVVVEGSRYYIEYSYKNNSNETIEYTMFDFYSFYYPEWQLFPLAVRVIDSKNRIISYFVMLGDDDKKRIPEVENKTEESPSSSPEWGWGRIYNEIKQGQEINVNGIIEPSGRRYEDDPFANIKDLPSGNYKMEVYLYIHDFYYEYNIDLDKEIPSGLPHKEHPYGYHYETPDILNSTVIIDFMVDP